MLAVVLIHVTSATLSRLDESSAAWLAVAFANRSLQFAVPAFLFMTALLLARSSLKPSWRVGSYYRGRLTGVLLPYLVWSALFGLFRVLMGERSLAGLLDWEQWRYWLTAGKAYYHLYFLVIVLQVYAVFPLLRPLVRARLSLAAVVALLAILQAAAYWLNREVLHHRAPASLAISHIVPLGLGLWLGGRLEAYPGWWRALRWPLGLAALAAWVGFLPQALSALRDVPVDTFAAAASGWAYSGLLSLILLGVALSWRWPPRLLVLLGRHSLQVYLLHAAVIAALNKLFDAQGSAPLLTMMPLFALSIAVPLALAEALRGTRAARWLFGR